MADIALTSVSDGCPYREDASADLCPTCDSSEVLQCDDYAIVVGISRYIIRSDRHALCCLDGAVADATAFATWVHAIGKVPRINIYRIISKDPPDTGERPIQDDIDEAFVRVFDKATRHPARRLYIYFAGHGFAASSKHVALIMANADKQWLNYSIDSADYHEGLLRQPYIKEQIFFYDCCREFDKRVRGRRAAWNEIDPIRETEPVKQLIIYGSAFTQIAYERETVWNQHRGLFTAAMLEGLKGSAVRNDGRITGASLYEYLESRLPELAKEKLNLNQSPSRDGTALGDELEIVRLDQVLTPVTIEAVGIPDGEEIIVKDGNYKVINKGVLISGKISFRLPPGFHPFLGSNKGTETCAHVTRDKPLIVKLTQDLVA